MKAVDIPSGIPMLDASHLSQNCEPKHSGTFGRRTMEIDFQSSEKRSELSAQMMAIAILTVGALAKLGVATQLLRLTH
jgi:hypothetical protein